MCCADTLLFTDVMFAVIAVLWSCAASDIVCVVCGGADKDFLWGNN